MTEGENETGIIEVGLLPRRSLRTLLALMAARRELAYTENKGLLTSLFVITAPPVTWDHLKQVMVQYNNAGR